MQSNLLRAPLCQPNIRQNTTWLDMKLVEWKPAKNSPMKLNDHLLFANENMIEHIG
ncbi:MAG: hypothetical protein KKG09_00450 [Verrucomicrobia bacterium]|nr:hypothetical protein [Verrucomicrobiota bacterium]MBU4496461.1 hypothetical protein [Verrucomicrobiota bacterium]MCG2679673.1 hypothetical protein [Kiritimatiellia bacterium]